MKKDLFARGMFSAQGGVKVFSSRHGATIEVDPSVFVTTVHKLQALVESATTHQARLAVRLLHDLCLAHHSGGKGIRYQKDIAEALEAFIDHDGYVMTLKVSDPHECRIMLDAMVCADFSSAPRMNPAILDRVDALSPQPVAPDAAMAASYAI